MSKCGICWSPGITECVCVCVCLHVRVSVSTHMFSLCGKNPCAIPEGAYLNISAFLPEPSYPQNF